MKDKKRVALYLSHHKSLGNQAATINTKYRAYAMEQAGYRVIVLPHQPSRLIQDIFMIFRILPSVTDLVIRIDGSEMLDKFTLLKLCKPRLHIIWEVHAFPEENYDMNFSKPRRLHRIKSQAKRYFLSLFVSHMIFISRELKAYARQKIRTHNSTVIPNFIPPTFQSVPHETFSSAIEVFNTKKYFTVLWGGFGQLHWQALDVVEKVARRMYQTDPTVLFLIVCSESWHRFQWDKNILFLHSYPRSRFLQLVAATNSCLALYHKPLFTPFYFTPLKIMDYMMAQKPIIATNQPSIRSMITDGENGLLTDNSTNDIVKKILLLKHNRALASRLGINAGRSIRAAYLKNNIVTNYRNILNSSGA